MITQDEMRKNFIDTRDVILGPGPKEFVFCSTEYAEVKEEKRISDGRGVILPPIPLFWPPLFKISHQ